MDSCIVSVTIGVYLLKLGIASQTLLLYITNLDQTDFGANQNLIIFLSQCSSDATRATQPIVGISYADKKSYDHAACTTA